MKKFVVSILCAGAFVSSAMAADTKPAMDAKTLEMMKKYEAAGTPGPEHKRLNDLVGSWKTSVQSWHAPNSKAEVSQGSANFKMILDGRWLQQEMTGTAMGQKFTGMGLLGYDNVKGKYESIWLDTMSTTLMRAEGSYDESTKTLKDKGSFSSPVTADKTDKFRSEWQMVSKNKMVFSLYGANEGGPEFKMMEVTYTK